MSMVFHFIIKNLRWVRWLIVGGVFCFMVWILYTPSGTKFVIQSVLQQILGVQKVSWEHMQGSLARGILVTHLDIQEIPYLSPGSFIRIQELKMALSHFAIKGINISLHNGRLFFKGEEPIVFEAQIQEGEVQANVYTQSLNLLDLRQVLAQFFDMALFKGDVRDVDILITGSWNKPNIRGQFFVERLVLPEFVLHDVVVRPQLQLHRSTRRWERFGILFLDSGSFENQWVKVQLQASRLIFSGPRSVYPEFDVYATTRVAQTDIFIHAQGTHQKQQIALTSDPSYSQEQLLFMLTTGRRWSGVEKAVQEDHQELAGYVIDYLLFGGSRSKIIQKLWLSDISISADEKKQGIRVSKELTQRLDIGYGVEFEQGDTQQKSVVQRLDSQYRLTNKLTIGIQKEFKSDSDRNDAKAVGDEPSLKSYPIGMNQIPDDRVYLKYRTTF